MDQDVVPLVPLEEMALPVPEGWTLGDELATWKGTRVFEAHGPDALGVAFVTHARSQIDEAQRRTNALAAFSHPSLIPVLGTGPVGPLVYRLDAEAPGPSSAVHARLEGPLPIDTALQIGLTLTQVLVELHARAFVHGRVEPESVRIDVRRGKPVPVLCDAAATLQDGPSRHSAPELRRGHAPDPRSDLFGVGLTLIALLTGQAPEVRDVKSGPACSLGGLSIDTRVFRLIESLVDADPSQRPRSATEVEEALARVRGASDEAAIPWKPLAAGLVLTLAASPVFWFTRHDREPVEVEREPAVVVAQVEAPVVEPDEVDEPVEPIVDEPEAPPARRAVQPVSDLSVEAVDEESPQVEAAEEPPEPVVEEPPEPVVEEAVALVEPAVEAPSILQVGGTWSGQANGRHVTLTLTQDGAAISGTAALQLGAQLQRRPVSGSIDGAQVVLVEQVNRGSTYRMNVSGDAATGSITQGGRDRGSFSLTR